jgi:phage shock protein PspC (stress-responsive transcriptional regulator)
MAGRGTARQAEDMNTSATNPESTTDADAGPAAQPTGASSDSGSQSGPAGWDRPGFSKDSASDQPGYSGAGQSGGHGYSDPPRPFGAGIALGSRDLSRPVHDRMLAGVASGLARYLNIDVTLVRVVLAVLVFVGGAGIPIYLAGWLLIPEDGADRSIASDLLASLENRSR